jgi:hypothetical protein
VNINDEVVLALLNLPAQSFQLIETAVLRKLDDVGDVWIETHQRGVFFFHTIIELTVWKA